MMPVMDGVELIQFLKKDERTCHIPFIMLTARGDLESKLESLENGVDDYMGKPFYPEELKARVANIIVQRQLLKGHYKKEFLQDPDFYINGKSGEKFMDKVVQLIKENLSNPEFNVESLSDALHVSRLQLYRKITAMTGFSPVSFIRNIRLKVASKMFSQNELNVTQVMLEVGFSSPSYFTECFRELFGCNPSEYIKRTREGSL
jgi:YesN/AraC family two-component response regulator